MEEPGSVLQHEDLLILLRAKLNEEKVKLWEAPYSVCPNSLEELAHKYASSLKKEEDAVLSGLRELQAHAVSRAKANDEYKESGLATFRVRASIPNDKMKQFQIQCKLDVIGSELIGLVAAEIPICDNRVKLIVNGKMIVRNKSLQEQGVKNGVQILALIMAETAEQLQAQDGLYQAMQATRDDAELLTTADSDLFQSDSPYMKLEDQSGNTIQLAESSRRALMVGLALHEHGRTAIRADDYRLALVLLLEADRHFSECDASVLRSVDNWALLQLDIAWCYLCLRSLAAAADAEQRLQRAEEALQRSYGDNMERLIALKGTDANERTLIMRLHLLQAIVAYHQNRRERARTLLVKAEQELNALRVNENDVIALVELGWSKTQARTGLRASGGSPDVAHHYLSELSDKRKHARHQAKQERRQASLGVCTDGTTVSREFVKLLVGMGYPRRLAVAALQNSNNHVSEAVRIIQEQPELLSAISPSESVSSLDSAEVNLDVDEESIAVLMSLGYDSKAATAALKQLGNDVEGAIDLLTRGGMLGIEESGCASTSQDTSNKSKVLLKKIKEEATISKKRSEALERLSQAIGSEDDSHLDTTLQQEETFLAQYKSLLM